MIQARSNLSETLRRLFALAERTTSIPERELALQKAHALQIKYQAYEKSSYADQVQTARKCGFNDDERPLRGIHYFYRKGYTCHVEISECSQEWTIVQNGVVRDRGVSAPTLERALTQFGFSPETPYRFRSRD